MFHEGCCDENTSSVVKHYLLVIIIQGSYISSRSKFPGFFMTFKDRFSDFYRPYNLLDMSDLVTERCLKASQALLLFYSVEAMASCTYIPQIMLNNVF